MSPHLYQAHSLAADGGGIDRALLAETKEYLEARRRGEDPGPQLDRSWQQFYYLCNPLIKRWVAAHSMTGEDQLDCVQEVWQEVLTRLHQFRYDPARGAFRTWLYAVTRNKALDVIRNRRRHPIECLSGEIAGSLPGRDADPADNCERRQTRAAVRGAVGRLSGKVSEINYQVIYLRWIEGRSVPEIATALGLTPEQVHYRHHRAMKRFRDLI